MAAALGDRDQQGPDARRAQKPPRQQGLLLIGAPGFEPGTSPTRTVRATRLRHAPTPHQYPIAARIVGATPTARTITTPTTPRIVASRERDRRVTLLRPAATSDPAGAASLAAPPLLPWRATRRPATSAPRRRADPPLLGLPTRRPRRKAPERSSDASPRHPANPRRHRSCSLNARTRRAHADGKHASERLSLPTAHPPVRTPRPVPPRPSWPSAHRAAQPTDGHQQRPPSL